MKILIARRGRPVTREQLMELLWPGEDPAKLGNRLSVALTTLRTVLGRDPDVIRADADAVSLDLTRVAVDVERFLAEVERRDRARRDAERLYAGDFLEEDAYEDWALDLRDAGARGLRVDAARPCPLATDDDEAVRAYLRLLEHDPYDAERAPRADRPARPRRAPRRGDPAPPGVHPHDGRNRRPSRTLRPLEGAFGRSGSSPTQGAPRCFARPLRRCSPRAPCPPATRQAAPLDWTPCDDGFQCATAQVPLDYDKPAGPKL